MTPLQGAVLIVFSGLPGTGKTTISRELTRRVGATYVRVDAIEQSLQATGMEVGVRGYIVANALAEENLRLDRPVVVDCVNPVMASRKGWRETAKRTSSLMFEIELVCSSSDEHRRRVEGRSADIVGHTLPSWNEVSNQVYERWDRDHLILDTAETSIVDAVDIAEAHIRGASSLGQHLDMSP